MKKGFAEAALALYREKGYAATPVRFDEALLPYLNYVLTASETICDAICVDSSMMALAIRTRLYDGSLTWDLRIVTITEGKANYTDFRMPGAFQFDREAILDWQMGIEFIE